MKNQSLKVVFTDDMINISYFPDETLQPQYHKFVKPARAIYPLSKALGPVNALAPEDDENIGTESNIAYDPLWVPNVGILGSPLFSARMKSQIMLDLSPIFPSSETVTAFSILVWVRIRAGHYRDVVVSTIEL